MSIKLLVIINNVKTKTDVPISFKLTHIHRKEMFNYN